MIASGAAYAQALPQKGGNPKFKTVKGKILNQQMAKTAAKGTAGVNERLIGASTYQGDIMGDSATYVYSGTRYAAVNNMDLGSYQEQYNPAANDAPFELGNSITNYLAYDTMRYYANEGSGLALGLIVTKQYDTDDRLTRLNVLDFNAGVVNDQRRYAVSYEGTGTDIKQTVMLQDTSALFSGLFDTVGVMSVAYQSAGRRDKDSFRSYLDMEYQRATYAYTASGRIASLLYSSSSDGVTFTPDSRVTYTYDGSDRLVAGLEEFYDGTAWQPDYVDSFGYTGSSALYTYNKTYFSDGTSWIPVFQWDGILNPTFTAFDTAYVMQDLGFGIQPLMQLVFKYNTNEHLTNLDLYFADTAGGYAEDPIAEIRYFYGPIDPVSVATAPAQQVPVKLYPNPATSHVFVEAEGQVSVSVYNLSGQLLIQQNGMAQNGSLQLNIANLPAGTYLADVQTEKGSSKVKFLKQ